MKAGMPATEEVHIALNKAVNEDEPDEKLIKLLLDCGASPLTNGCKTLINVTQKVSAPSLKLLLRGDIPVEDINRAFSGAFNEESFPTWFTIDGLEVAHLLLEKGATGDALSGALILAMKNSDEDSAGLADQFIEVLLSHGADVNFENGEPMKQAASKANVSWTQQLLKCHPSGKTLLVGFNHIFDTALSPDEAIQLFEMFTEHQDGEVRMDVVGVNHGSDPVLIRAITQYPRSTEVLRTLLDAGFYYDQHTVYRLNDRVEEPEEVSLLTWAIAQPQKKVSTNVIEVLIESGGKFLRV